MIYKSGALNQIAVAATNYFAVFKKLLNQYLRDLKQEDLLYFPSEIRDWLNFLKLAQNSQISIEHIKLYCLESVLKPCVADLYKQRLNFNIAVKKCFVISAENDENKVKEYSVDLFFKHINLAINSNLDFISTIDLDNFTTDHFEDLFVKLEADFKQGFLNEICKNHTAALLETRVKASLESTQIPKESGCSLGDKSFDSINTLAESKKTSSESSDVASLTTHFQSFFAAEPNKPQNALIWRTTIDTELGEVEEIIIDTNNHSKTYNTDVSPVTVCL